MKEIKLRAWMKRHKKYMYVKGLVWRDNKIVHIRGEYYHNGELRPIGGHADHMDMNDLILEQFTGRKDVDGVEIYDGDRLSVGEYKIDVNWEETVSGWYPLYRDDVRDISMKYNTINADDIKNCKVIGNIHESKE